MMLAGGYKRLQMQLASHCPECGAGSVVGWTLVRGPSVTLLLFNQPENVLSRDWFWNSQRFPSFY